MVAPFLVGKNEGEPAMLCSGFPDFYVWAARGGLPPAGGAERKLGFTGNKEVDVVFLQKKRRTPVKEFLQTVDKVRDQGLGFCHIKVPKSK